MQNTPLTEILIAARQESTRMRHYYLGVEHLFVALLEVRNGLLAMVLSEEGLSPDYVINAVRRKVGKGGKSRVHNGFPNTPRTEVILDIAQEIALSDNRQQMQERDLVLAILEEGESIPVYVLRALGLDLSGFRSKAQIRPVARSVTRPFIHIEVGPQVGLLSEEQLYILRKMFNGYARIHVDQRLSSPYSATTLLLVTPVQLDMRQKRTVIVKIDTTAAIIAESQRYERHVKQTLPDHTAQVHDKPTAPETASLAGLQYTFAPDASDNEQQAPPRVLRDMVQQWSGAQIGRWLKDRLFKAYNQAWWRGDQTYEFKVWREYDWVLPPMLTLETFSGDLTDTKPGLISPPINSRTLSALQYGKLVYLDGFTVQHIDHERNVMHMAMGDGTIGSRPYHIEMRGVDLDNVMYYRGEVIDRITGRVWRTRAEQMGAYLRLLRPDFELDATTLDFEGVELPNPVRHYPKLLEEKVKGTLSTIHGNLHLGNVLVGSDEAPLLVDFASTRAGHTLYDWASLEISILDEWLAPLMASGWAAVCEIASYINTLNKGKLPENAPPEYADAFQAIYILRQLVSECLAKPDAWGEYYISLAMLSLRAVTREALPVDHRRLMFYVSALAMHAYGVEKQQVSAKPSVNLSTEVDLADIRAQLKDNSESET
jgi:hypothetical protein